MSPEVPVLSSPRESTARAEETRGSTESGRPREMLKSGSLPSHGMTDRGSSSAENSALTRSLYLPSSGTITPALLPASASALAHLAAALTSVLTSG